MKKLNAVYLRMRYGNLNELRNAVRLDDGLDEFMWGYN